MLKFVFLVVICIGTITIIKDLIGLYLLGAEIHLKKINTRATYSLYVDSCTMGILMVIIPLFILNWI